VPMRTVTVIEAPTSAGGYAPGQEDGPRALLEAGLVERLEAAGVAVRRGGQVTPFRWRPDADNRRAANAGAVIDCRRDPRQPRKLLPTNQRLRSLGAQAQHVPKPGGRWRAVDARGG
jgi:arginase family enzyme